MGISFKTWIFYCVIEPNKVIIYQQEYFHRRKLEIFKTSDSNFTTHRLSIDIKFRFFYIKEN
jgi:hypothetical protein